jgi:hypothetical protein
MSLPAAVTAFAGDVRLASGAPAEVASAMKIALERGERVLAFDDADGRQVDFDLSGPPEAVAARLAPPPAEPQAPRGPGRPRLGVVAREVTLLPRHWEWLAAQPGGASVALRKLVEEARRAGDGEARARQGRDAAYRFMAAMAGDRPGFEEAARALYAGDPVRFRAETEAWPADVRDHARGLAGF